MSAPKTCLVNYKSYGIIVVAVCLPTGKEDLLGSTGEKIRHTEH